MADMMIRYHLKTSIRGTGATKDFKPNTPLWCKAKDVELLESKLEQQAQLLKDAHFTIADLQLEVETLKQKPAPAETPKQEAPKKKKATKKAE